MMMSIIVRENIQRLRRAALHLINAAADNAYQGVDDTSTGEVSSQVEQGAWEDHKICLKFPNTLSSLGTSPIGVDN
jgi:hypothetical protein